MNNKLPKTSGDKLLKTLCNKFNYKLINSKGSHRTLLNPTTNPPTLLIIPIHHGTKQIMKAGTLQKIIAKTGITRQQFIEALNN